MKLTTHLERDDFSSNRHHALTFCWSKIFFRKPASTFRDHALAAAALALIATAATSPALAKARHHHPQQLYLNSAPASARDAALRECNAAVDPYNNRDFQGTQIIRYNGCMFEHGQMP